MLSNRNAVSEYDLKIQLADNTMEHNNTLSRINNDLSINSAVNVPISLHAETTHEYNTSNKNNRWEHKPTWSG